MLKHVIHPRLHVLWAVLVLTSVALLAMSRLTAPSVLMWAIDGGHRGLVQTMVRLVPRLANEATPAFESVGRRTPLQEAVIVGRTDIASDLISAGAHINDKDHLGFSALHYAADLGRVDVVELLLRHHAAPAQATAMGKYTPLALAAMKRHWAVVRQLVGHDRTTMPPLHWAVVRGDRKDVRRLLQADAAAARRRDALERTPLHYAAMRGDPVLVQVLLVAGAEVNAKDWLRITALHLACREGDVPVAQELIRAGADVNAPDTDGSRPVHVAACSGSVRLLDVLFQAGARLDLKDVSGETPVARAQRCGQAAAVRYLQSLKRRKDAVAAQ